MTFAPGDVNGCIALYSLDCESGPDNLTEDQNVQLMGNSFSPYLDPIRRIRAWNSSLPTCPLRVLCGAPMRTILPRMGVVLDGESTKKGCIIVQAEINEDGLAMCRYDDEKRHVDAMYEVLRLLDDSAVLECSQDC